MAIGCLIVLNNDNDTKAFSATNKLLLLVNTNKPKDITETFFSFVCLTGNEVQKMQNNFFSKSSKNLTFEKFSWIPCS